MSSGDAFIDDDVLNFEESSFDKAKPYLIYTGTFLLGCAVGIGFYYLQKRL